MLLLDVSGSMEAYSRALLLYLHAARGSGRGVETFAFGTRLTRLTRELATRDPDAALAAAAGRVVDWSGGTRIGLSLKAYNDEWGRRALTRGAVVVILSDGFERGDPSLLGAELARLARQAFAVVWVNPLKGHEDYEPLVGGMQAALPHVDRLPHRPRRREPRGARTHARRHPAPARGLTSFSRRGLLQSARQSRPDESRRIRCLSPCTPRQVHELVDAAADVEQIATGFTFTEGPIWMPDGSLHFSDMPADKRRRWHPEEGVTVLRDPSNKCNGMTLDNDGNLIVCEHVTSSVVRERPDGTRETIATHSAARS